MFKLLFLLFLISCGNKEMMAPVFQNESTIGLHANATHEVDIRQTTRIIISDVNNPVNDCDLDIELKNGDFSKGSIVIHQASGANCAHFNGELKIEGRKYQNFDYLEIWIGTHRYQF